MCVKGVCAVRVCAVRVCAVCACAFLQCVQCVRDVCVYLCVFVCVGVRVSACGCCGGFVCERERQTWSSWGQVIYVC